MTISSKRQHLTGSKKSMDMRAEFESVDYVFLREYVSELEAEALSAFEADSYDDDSDSIVSALTASRPSDSNQRDIIDRFLQCNNKRIVIDESLVLDDESDVLGGVEITTTSALDANFASEQLAQIYLDQGLYSKSIDIYRQLSLLNSEKSAYFAEQIAQIEILKHKK